MRVATPHVFGAELVSALGLQGRSITSITMRVRVNAAVQVRVTEQLSEDHGKALLSVVRRYTLTPTTGVLDTPNDQRKEARDGQGN